MAAKLLARRLSVDYMDVSFSEFREEQRLQEARNQRLLEHSEWYTPMVLFRQLGVMFDVDVAASPLKRTPARHHITREMDGLKRTWSGLVWLSPPRHNPTPWIRKMHEYGNGIMLWKATTDTRIFHECQADAYLFPMGRIRFVDSMTLHRLDNAMQASALYAWGTEAVNILEHCKVGGMMLWPAPLPAWARGKHA